MIGHDELCSLIPHDGGMCLLEEVLAWDDESISCRSNSHLRLDNPLRSQDGLSSVHLIEYGAQAMAVHGSLRGRRDGKAPRPGYIVALRDVTLSVDWLHEIDAPLNVTALRVMGDADNMIYRFEIYAEEQMLGGGRVTVISVSTGGEQS